MPNYKYKIVKGLLCFKGGYAGPGGTRKRFAKAVGNAMYARRLWMEMATTSWGTGFLAGMISLTIPARGVSLPLATLN